MRPAGRPAGATAPIAVVDALLAAHSLAPVTGQQRGVEDGVFNSGGAHDVVGSCGVGGLGAAGEGKEDGGGEGAVSRQMSSVRNPRRRPGAGLAGALTTSRQGIG